MNLHNNHPYHLVDQSPWPLTGSVGALTLTSGMIKWIHSHNCNLLMLGIMISVMTMVLWWRNIVQEASFQGSHTNKVVTGLKMGMILFITSEVLFFMSFFWAFLHSSLAPAVEVGMTWPPMGINPFDPTSIPLLNTMILLCSGITITWAHHSILEGNHKWVTQGLMMTVILGLMFTALQAFEYWEASFSISDSIYGSTFFMSTGFHGIHVIIGTTFLSVCLMRHMLYHFSPKHHLGLEAAAWYWHFVDVVWLFLYMMIYWWGS
uniref:Cytochrome c oxidase subunit 3 n=1 Tax=Libiocoris heissi TaxID=1176477 RepID=A0A172DYV5_9HEMI|nr:cytochrome c oxidase subunit III [Libiocoris heissi]AFI54712.1 cytochrome c oxidase subunit III [Libiocoris heissi]